MRGRVSDIGSNNDKRELGTITLSTFTRERYIFIAASNESDRKTIHVIDTHINVNKIESTLIIFISLDQLNNLCHI
jgi:hypothetical protein